MGWRKFVLTKIVSTFTDIDEIFKRKSALRNKLLVAVSILVYWFQVRMNKVRYPLLQISFYNLSGYNVSDNIESLNINHWIIKTYLRISKLFYNFFFYTMFKHYNLFSVVFSWEIQIVIETTSKHRSIDELSKLAIESNAQLIRYL